jgi:hypothetical protein
MCLYLPRHFGGPGAEDDEQAPPTATEGAEGAGENVLVVDDEATIRTLVVELLDELGYTAIDAADGAGALEVSRVQRLRIQTKVCVCQGSATPSVWSKLNFILVEIPCLSRHPLCAGRSSNGCSEHRR